MIFINSYRSFKFTQLNPFKISFAKLPNQTTKSKFFPEFIFGMSKYLISNNFL